MSFGEWLEQTNERLTPAGLAPLEFRAAMEYHRNGYSPDEVASIEVAEAAERDDAIRWENFGSDREHRYP